MSTKNNGGPAISVIVPVYNVELYLAECLDSIEAQTFSDFEVIAVNDGSTDRSRMILEAYAAKDARIKIIDQPNAGLSAARNTGLDNASGEYVFFLDSDDLITPDAFEKTVRAARENNSDIVIFDYYVLDDVTGSLGFYRDQKIYTQLNGCTFTMEEAPQMAQFIGVWDRLFRRAFIEEGGIRYKEGKLYEDVPFCFETELRADRITLISDHLYYYRRNVAGSITGGESGSNRHRSDFLYVQKCALCELKAAGASDALLGYYARYFLEYAYMHNRRVSGTQAFAEFFEQIREMACFGWGSSSGLDLCAFAIDLKDPRIIFYKKCLQANNWQAAFFFMKSTNQLQRPYTQASWRANMLKAKAAGRVSPGGTRVAFPERQPEFVDGFSRECFADPVRHIEKVLEGKRAVADVGSAAPAPATPTVSILVPCYNVEKYLPACLDSVLAQDFEDFEAICINDGSKDSTLDIIKRYCAADARFKVIDKENSGYGASMNMGLDAARGEYIAILESDDMMEPNALSTLVREARENSADAVKANFFFFWSTPEPKREKNNLILKRHPHVVCPREFPEIFWFMPSIWSAIYSRDFLNKNNIRFLETPGASYQDLAFTFKVWARATRVALVKEAFVNYRQDNENSSINSPGKVFCVCDEFEEIERFMAADPQLASLETLKKVEVRLKFDSYIWNFGRLNPKLRQEFLPRFFEDFLLEDVAGNIDYGMFFPWCEADCKLLLRDPIKFLEVANKTNCDYSRPAQVARYLKAGGPELLKKRLRFKWD